MCWWQNSQVMILQQSFLHQTLNVGPLVCHTMTELWDMPCTSTRTLHGKESASTLKTSVSVKSIEVSAFVFITHAVELPVHYLPGIKRKETRQG